MHCFRPRGEEGLLNVLATAGGRPRAKPQTSVEEPDEGGVTPSQPAVPFSFKLLRCLFLSDNSIKTSCPQLDYGHLKGKKHGWLVSLERTWHTGSHLEGRDLTGLISVTPMPCT